MLPGLKLIKCICAVCIGAKQIAKKISFRKTLPVVKIFELKIWAKNGFKNPVLLSLIKYWKQQVRKKKLKAAFIFLVCRVGRLPRHLSAHPVPRVCSSVDAISRYNNLSLSSIIKLDYIGTGFPVLILFKHSFHTWPHIMFFCWCHF